MEVCQTTFQGFMDYLDSEFKKKITLFGYI